MAEEPTKKEDVQVPAPKPDPCQSGWEAIMEPFKLIVQVFSIIFTADNLVILCLTGMTIYALKQFGATKPDLASQIAMNVGSGMIGYLGGQIKQKLAGSP